MAETSHKRIIKATGLLGGAQVIEVLIRIARSKIIAILLGPFGVGVIGLYQSLVDMIRSATGFGLNFSAVRSIAKALGSSEEHQVSVVLLTLRRWVWFTGLLGMVLMLVFCRPLSQLTFGDVGYAPGIAILSIVLLLRSVSEGQLALLQGLRKIGMMAQAKVWGVVAGFVITVPLYLTLGVHGIVPAILITAIVSLFLSWYYSRKIHIPSAKVSIKEAFRGGLGMARLGFFLVITGFVTTATMYLLRAYISNMSSLEAVGQFQAAWNLSSIYLAAVLQAMGTDYLPRLSVVCDDNAKVVKLVNEQTEVALIVAGPLVVGMLSFMSLVVMILYSDKFDLTIRILHWQLAGTFLKVISWPIGFIFLAKAKGAIFVFTQICWNVMYLLVVYFGWQTFGLEITGIAFLISYVIYLVIILMISRFLCGFYWTKNCLKHILIFGILIVFVFFTSRYISEPKSYFIGGCLMLLAMSYSYSELRRIVDLKLILKKLFSVGKR